MNMMNITQGYIFVEAAAPHKIVIVWERADIDDMMDDMKYAFMGTCQYDVEKKYIQHYEG